MQINVSGHHLEITSPLREYVENKFRYTKNSSRGYRNQAAYIIRYKDDLEFEIVE